MKEKINISTIEFRITQTRHCSCGCKDIEGMHCLFIHLLMNIIWSPLQLCLEQEDLLITIEYALA